MSTRLSDNRKLLLPSGTNRNSTSLVAAMVGPSNKRQKREEFSNALKEDGTSSGLPQKKFYRQRAHANPFADHNLY